MGELGWTRLPLPAREEGESLSDRLKLIEVPNLRPRVDFASAVRDGLRSSPKSVPSRFFYDHRGSELFEQITELPEYYLTRCEASIFEACRSQIVAAAGSSQSLVEFGSGSSVKTKLLIDTILGRQEGLDYAPIDISEDFLIESSEGLLAEFAGLRITALAGEYFDCVSAMPLFDRPRLILFLGSNIGNFEHDEATEFLSLVAKAMRPEDRLLVGTDLVKDADVIERAYNDSAGVTAAFNLNVLSRINEELTGKFDLGLFEHSAPYLVDEERIEMRLISRVEQDVCVEGLDLALSFAEGEYLHTEYSQKYTPESFGRIVGLSGLQPVERWTDERGWFALNLLRTRV